MSLAQDTIVWNNRYILGIPVLDKQHRHMVDIANELFAACIESPDIVSNHFLENASIAIARMNYYFIKEEKLMAILYYQGYLHHKREHENFMGEALKQSEELKFNKKIIPRSFVYFFRDWLLSHITVSDKVLANYILEMRQSGRLRQLLEVRQEGALLTA